MAAKKRKVLPVRGFMIHITHYDGKWIANKSRERPFDLKLGLEIVDAMAEADMNLLVIDCADGVKYKSHPELKRKYSIPMSSLRKLVKRAQENDIEVVPKLNFSQGRHFRHNDWFRPHMWLLDNKKYWKLAFEVIDELIENCEPRRFFHVGMDEDDLRAHSQYIAAIKTLRTGLKKRKLRTVIWSDSTHTGSMLFTAEKCMVAEKKIPKDIVEVLWDYRYTKPEHIRRLVREGFDVWVAPGRDTKKVRSWREAALRWGGKGILLTNWAPCRPSNRSMQLEFIRTLGPICKNG